MLFLLITCLSSFIFLFNLSLPLKPIPSSWSSETRLISFFFFKDLFSSLFSSPPPHQMSPPPTNKSPKTLNNDDDDNQDASISMSVLDLPDLALESILERLPPDALFRMSSVCSDLKERCLSDHLWRNHFYRKWGSIIGPAAYRQWQCHLSSSSSSFASSTDDFAASCLIQSRRGVVSRGLIAHLSRLWPFMLVRSSNSNSNPNLNPQIHNFNHNDCNTNSDSDSDSKMISQQHPAANSVVAFYQALESGKFWFPAQVFNRENGHVGFMLSCYDAELSYDSCTDTFQARYPPHGRRAVALESLITWDRLRAAPIDTSPHDLHVSECLKDLRPKDHIEIQWRRNKEFPYGWWYGIVGHLETCDGNETYCRCHESDTVVLEFNQYTPGSRWRHTTINRKDHREEGNEADGFYGGIRKLYRNDEISMWKHFWPAEILE